jgi:hypothetical protein
MRNAGEQTALSGTILVSVARFRSWFRAEPLKLELIQAFPADVGRPRLGGYSGLRLAASAPPGANELQTGLAVGPGTADSPGAPGPSSSHFGLSENRTVPSVACAVRASTILVPEIPPTGLAPSSMWPRIIEPLENGCQRCATVLRASLRRSPTFGVSRPESLSLASRGALSRPVWGATGRLQ